MPELTVIEGGGRPVDEKTSLTRQAFDDLLMEVLRALGRGDDHEFRILRAMERFINNGAEASIPAGEIIRDRLTEIHETLLRQGPDNSSTEDSKAIIEAGLQVLAESIADDRASRGRKSQRANALREAIESYVIARERRSRTHGWSYLQSLSKRMDGMKPSD